MMILSTVMRMLILLLVTLMMMVMVVVVVMTMVDVVCETMNALLPCAAYPESPQRPRCVLLSCKLRERNLPANAT